MSAKLKFTRVKPRVKLDPIYKQWAVIFPQVGRTWKPHSMTYFETWSAAIKFALASVSMTRAPIPIDVKKKRKKSA